MTASYHIHLVILFTLYKSNIQIYKPFQPRLIKLDKGAYSRIYFESKNLSRSIHLLFPLTNSYNYPSGFRFNHLTANAPKMFVPNPCITHNPSFGGVASSHLPHLWGISTNSGKFWLHIL